MFNNRRPPIAWIFFFLMFAAFSSGNFSAMMWVVFISIILVALFGFGSLLTRFFSDASNMINALTQGSADLAQQMRSRSQPFDDGDDADLRPRVVPKEVAQRAIQRAGNRASDWLLSLEDIGLLAYHGDDTPDVVRLNPVAADTTHLRPFAVINIPYKQGKGTITFELFDELGTRRYIAREQYSLTQGANFITPRTYLPLPDERTSGMWTLRLSIGDKLLAEHEFPVRTRVATPVRNLLSEDGEVDPWLARAIVDQGSQKSGLSLDELLADQADDRESRLR